ncbi:1-acyl-sn-glycerol-3-phosphate acyltransferase [Marinimicrobium alkaliphilum]|uniref:1-acyl-sn-glycerol-3-phosphate acyltransferase n=1 Tax=Marinimicrobium alkaliphilum TaxID=2202654 RepID=UPI000DB9D7F2|nr:1-acyl-sn-glycerol-3-phosphate acyltransferase [Marinimicrobium alkaliphilum]
MTDFDDIRPYHDHEVRPVLDRLLADPELAEAVTRLKFPRASRLVGPLLRPLVRRAMRRQLAGVQSVYDFQLVIEKYMRTMLETTTSGLTTSGLDRLDPQQAYLFISNHRDIAMDPAFVNWTLYHAGFNTLRIAIGDNLLTKPYVSDLMRLNKSFIVNRSAKAAREKFKAAKKLSAYIHHSIVNDRANIWIAQREGRAKDGKDKTNPAVIGMLTLSKPKPAPLADYVHQLNIVPVSISYEWDPCDAAKAREVYHQRTSGGYQKEQHEDVKSIALGISGQKGRVHVAFGRPLQGDYSDDDQVVSEIDQQILEHYVLQPTNCFAWELLHGEVPRVTWGPHREPYDPAALRAQRHQFELRMQAIPSEQRRLALENYANPVASKLASA